MAPAIEIGDQARATVAPQEIEASGRQIEQDGIGQWRNPDLSTCPEKEGEQLVGCGWLPAVKEQAGSLPPPEIFTTSLYHFSRPVMIGFDAHLSDTRRLHCRHAGET